ncbi:conserved hypothetical protein [Denitrovibrio acetiphilus DSM 12809]|uniref:DUF5610 domain-containing protein n=1 Tax=Denitrovibrio acetiphilus (strain DSM 12809 / NBRC 114555 / N2460) TaxID=522772 RepID=D4H1L7_DENA2|nr:hypothetical protein [Denitrovibrio acetiphilus]ADD68777.1 conserved hypothetical protein [Denitrovibrio acetiphilus DSM 12809]
MYISNSSAQTFGLRYSYAEQQTSKTREGQNTAKSEDSGTTQAETSEKAKGFSDVLDIMSADISPMENLEAYVQKSISKILEKIAKHASETSVSQASRFSVSYTSINISIEFGEGESLSDVKSQLDEMLSEDGYWGVEKTSQRMFDFAVAISGDDPETLQKAKEAVQKGFDQTEALFGGQLPDISYDTYEATMEKFDNYIEQINSSLDETYA